MCEGISRATIPLSRYNSLVETMSRQTHEHICNSIGLTSIVMLINFNQHSL